MLVGASVGRSVRVIAFVPASSCRHMFVFVFITAGVGRGALRYFLPPLHSCIHSFADLPPFFNHFFSPFNQRIGKNVMKICKKKLHSTNITVRNLPHRPSKSMKWGADAWWESFVDKALLH